jgi:hypothetical protein
VLAVCTVMPPAAASSVAVKRLAAHQCGQHVGAGGIADERADLRDVRSFFHLSISCIVRS